MQQAYGLNILPPQSIPGFVSASPLGKPDAVIQFNDEACAGHADRAHIQFEDGVSAVLSPFSAEICIQFSASSSFEDVCTYIQGPVLGFFAQLRGGRAVLHACSAVIGGQALAFAGESTIGKSTLAAVWAQAGYAVLSDDVCVCLEDETGIRVPPGCFHVRLWPGAVKLLFGREDALPLIAPPWEKRYLDLMEMGRFQTEPAPLSAVYAMEPAPADAELSIHPLRGHAAVMALVKNSYGIHRLNSAQRADELKKMAALADRIPVYRLLVPHTADRAFRIRDAILSRHV